MTVPLVVCTVADGTNVAEVAVGHLGGFCQLRRDYDSVYKIRVKAGGEWAADVLFSQTPNNRRISMPC